MSFLTRLFQSASKVPAPTVKASRPPYEQIVDAMDPWTLACAVGAANGTVGVPMGLDRWLDASRVNWQSEVQSKSGASVQEIDAAVRRFVFENIHLHMNLVLSKVNESRGMPPAVLLGPGETMQITVG